MNFDIHGNNLRSGHCEVHPWVHEEYPCSMCNARSFELNKKATAGRICRDAGALNQKVQLRLEADKPSLSVQDNGLLIEVALFLTELNMRLEV